MKDEGSKMNEQVYQQGYRPGFSSVLLPFAFILPPSSFRLHPSSFLFEPLISDFRLNLDRHSL